MTISTNLFSERMLSRFSELNEAIQTRQTKISTGEAIINASDAPIAAVRLSALNETTAKVETYQANLTVAERRLSLGDKTLSTVDNLYTRLREVQLSAASDTVSAGDRASIRLEIENIHEQLVGLANTADTSGQALFGGYATDLQPFLKNEDGSVSYLGDSGDHTLRAGDTLRLPTSINGGDVFMRVETGGEVHSAFDIIDTFAQSLDASTEYKTFSQNLTTGGLTLDIVSDRRPQNFTMDITGPNGAATVSFVAVDGNPAGAKSAINAVSAATGVTASDSADGRSLELTAVSTLGTETISIENVAIEGQMLAQFPPSYYLRVTPSVEGRAALLTSMRANAPVAKYIGVPFTAPNSVSDVKTAIFELEGKEYTLTYTPSGSTSVAGTVAVSTQTGEADFLTASVVNANSKDTISLIVQGATVNGIIAGGTLDGSGPKPMNNADAVVLGLANEVSSSAGAAHAQTVMEGLAFTGLTAGTSRNLTVNLNGKTIQVTHAKASDGTETVTTDETFITSQVSNVSPGTGTRANIWTATADSMSLILEGASLSATPATGTSNVVSSVSVSGSSNVLTANADAMSITLSDGAGGTANIAVTDANLGVALTADQRATALATAINNNATLDAKNIKATATSDGTGNVNLIDPNARAAALATAINDNVALAGKGITAQASTDGSGTLAIGTLIAKDLSASVAEAGAGKAATAGATRLSLSADAVLRSIAVVADDGSTSMGFNVSQQNLADVNETLVVPVSQGLDAYKEHMSALGESIALAQTVVGSRLQRVTSQGEVLADRSLVLSQEVNDLSAADIETLITELTSLMVSRDASRQAFSMISQSSLFDFIK